jgi:hypothetical protein
LITYESLRRLCFTAYRYAEDWRLQEVGATLLDVKEEGRFACSASACNSKPLRSTRSNSWRKAAISPPTTVA